MYEISLDSDFPLFYKPNELPKMQIDVDLLFTLGAVAKRYKKNDVIFYEDDWALFYYQIIEGSVRLYNSNNDGKEFTQGIFKKGNCFGEPPLFINEVHPSTAIALADCVIIKLTKEKLMKILEDVPTLKISFLVLMAQHIFDKTIIIKQIISHKSENRIIFFLENYKKQNQLCCTEKSLILHTRQEIADATGLRVETVIRSLSLMNKLHIVTIKKA